VQSDDQQAFHQLTAQMSREAWQDVLQHMVDSSLEYGELHAKLLMAHTILLLDIRDRLPPLTTPGST
jgi:hypothetical protein